MRKDFYIFRHGETDYNKEMRWQGCGVDLPLNATGIAQAVTLSERLKPLKLEVIYSSPLKRALETAQIAASQLKLKVKLLPDLREGCLGVCENGAVWIMQSVEQRAIYFISEALVIVLDHNDIVNNMHEPFPQGCLLSAFLREFPEHFPLRGIFRF